MALTLVFPRWLFPKNLGDSIVVGILPPILRDFYNAPVKVLTYGEDYCRLMSCVVDGKDIEWVNCKDQIPLLDYRTHAMSNYNRATHVKVVYPEWHPNLWDEYKHFYGRRINILAVNYLLQLGFDHHFIEDLLLKCPNKLLPTIRTQTKYPGPRMTKIGIVPDTKLANRPMPHPGCDGIGYRFNGPNGEQSWATLVSELRAKFGRRVQFVEFSENSQLNLGDRIIGHTDSLFKLAQIVEELDFCILSDGGMHHLCNAMGVPTYLLNAQKINKAEYFQTSLDWVGCRSCKCDITTIKGWPDLDKVCNLECEKIDPKEVAEEVIQCLNYRKIIV